MKSTGSFFALLLILTSFGSALATQGPVTYDQPAATFSSGGGEVSNGSYTLLSSIGQPGIIGTSSGGGNTVNHGFLSVLGDGFTLLYPVIAVDKGSFSFTLASNASPGNDTLAVSNDGGSTLNWSIAKKSASSWLTASPASGSGAFTVNVSANASGLTVGNIYTDTLVISGSGIDQTVQVGVSLSVTAPLTYRLTVTVVSNTAGKGGGSVNNGTGVIACTNTGSDPATATGICQADLLAGSSITLLQLPDSNSTLATWSGGSCSGTGNCSISNIAANKNVTATFPYSSMAKVNSTSSGFEELGLAYSGAGVTDTIFARAVTFPTPNWLMNAAKTITLKGGRDAYYADLSNQYSILSGKLSISNGKLIVEKLKVK